MDLPPTSTEPRHRAALAFIYVTVLLDMLAFGIVIPVLPHLIGQLAGGGIAKGSFAGIFGPYLFAQVVALSIAPSSPVHLPGVAFVLSAALVGLVIAARITRGLRAKPASRPEEAIPSVSPGDLPPLATVHPSESHPPQPLSHPSQEDHP